MKFLFFFTFLICSHSYAELNGWKLVRDTKGVRVWISKDNPNITGSMEIRKLIKKIEWTDSARETYFKGLNVKKNLLAFIGITNWNVQQHSWSQENEIYYLKVIGSYINSAQQEIVFVEEHAFLPDKTVQLLYTKPANLKDSFPKTDTIIPFMKKKSGVFNI